MNQQPYDLFDIDKGTDKIFFIGTSFIILLLFLLWSKNFCIQQHRRSQNEEVKTLQKWSATALKKYLLNYQGAGG